MTQLWQANISTGVPISTSEICPPRVWGTDLATMLSATSDGRYAVLALGTNSYVVNLADGTLRSDQNATGVLGPYVEDTILGDNSNQATSVVVTEPATGKAVTTWTDPTLLSVSDQLLTTQGGTAVVATSESGAASCSGYTESWALPGGAQQWKIHTPNSLGQILQYDDPSTHTLVISDNAGDDGVYSFDDHTGKQLWTVPSVSLCDAWNGKVYVSANNQLAVLDASTGQQLSYDTNKSKCPDILPDGFYDTTSNTGTQTVYTVLRLPY